MHLVKKLEINISSSEKRLGERVMSKTPELFERALYSRIDSLLDRYHDDNHISQIERLELTLSPLIEENWEENLIEEILLSLDEYMKNQQGSFPVETAKPKGEQAKLSNISERADELILYFMRYGVVPENSMSQEIVHLVQKIKLSPQFVQDMISLIREKPASIFRFFYNIDGPFVRKFIDYFMQLHKEDIQKYQQKTKEPEKDTYEGVRELILFFDIIFYQKKNYSNEEIAEIRSLFYDRFKINSLKLNEITAYFIEFFQSQKLNSNLLAQIDQILKNDHALQHDDSETRSEELDEKTKMPKESTKDKGDQISHLYIENAGLVLLQGFLPKLFLQLGYIDEKMQFVGRQKARAALVLQYCITGKEKFFENELSLNKLLCGIEIDETVQTNLSLSEEEKNEADKLLLSLIHHWGVLKNTSLITLRESFLQRKAKLILNRDVKQVIVENKGIDILLDQFPLSFSYIYHRWMHHPLEVQWH